VSPGLHQDEPGNRNRFAETSNSEIPVTLHNFRFYKMRRISQPSEKLSTSQGFPLTKCKKFKNTLLWEKYKNCLCYDMTAVSDKMIRGILQFYATIMHLNISFYDVYCKGERSQSHMQFSFVWLLIMNKSDDG
jgi:hypothetical protein